MNDITKIKVADESESSYQLYPRNEEFAKRSGGGDGGSGVQPDWNQNDETQPDYVKNRPFYTGDPVETVLLEKTTPEFDNAEVENLYAVSIPIDFSVERGQTYKVFWDGTVYECVCTNFSESLYFGNMHILTAAGIGIGFPDTGEPFLMSSQNQGDSIALFVYTQDTSASHTISIRGFDTPIVKIDEKYLPDTVVQPDWNQNDDTQPDYVKNRPFYTTPAGTELVNGTFRFIYNSAIGFYSNSGTITIELTEGKTYKVTLDGVEYETVCQVFQAGILYIGAPEFINGGTPPSDMPFICTYNTGNGYVTFATITDGSHFIIIKEVFTQIVKIPEQYIPEMSSVTLLSSTSGSTKKFKIKVDDSGTITATELI